MLTKFEDGFLVSNREFYGIKCLTAVLNELLLHKKSLWDRMKVIPHGRRDYALVISVLSSLIQAIMLTIPTKKLYAIQKELDATKIHFLTNPVTIPKDDGYIVMKTDDVLEVANYIVGQECNMCDRLGQEVKQCRHRRAIDKMMHCNVEPDDRTGRCPLDGYDELRKMNIRDID